MNDELDDELLQRSIESAAAKGKWRGDDAAFADPKLRQIAQQLATKPPENYTERRLREMQARIAAKEQGSRGSAEPPPKVTFGAPADSVWRDNVAAPKAAAQSAPASTAPPPSPPSSEQAALAPSANVEPSTAIDAATVLAWARHIGAAAMVFAVGTTVHACIGGFSASLVWRGLAAALVTGAMWHVFATGRFRCAAIGTAAHLVAFLGTSPRGDGTQLLAVFVSMLLVLIGSSIVGFAREANGSHRPLRG